LADRTAEQLELGELVLQGRLLVAWKGLVEADVVQQVGVVVDLDDGIAALARSLQSAVALLVVVIHGCRLVHRRYELSELRMSLVRTLGARNARPQMQVLLLTVSSTLMSRDLNTKCPKTSTRVGP
jgi:hypothetical protein